MVNKKIPDKKLDNGDMCRRSARSAGDRESLDVRSWRVQSHRWARVRVRGIRSVRGRDYFARWVVPCSACRVPVLWLCHGLNVLPSLNAPPNHAVKTLAILRSPE